MQLRRFFLVFVLTACFTSRTQAGVLKKLPRFNFGNFFGDDEASNNKNADIEYPVEDIMVALSILGSPLRSLRRIQMANYNLNHDKDNNNQDEKIDNMIDMMNLNRATPSNLQLASLPPLLPPPPRSQLPPPPIFSPPIHSFVHGRHHHRNNNNHEFMRTHLQHFGPHLDQTRARARELITERRSQAPADSVFSDAVEKFNGLMHKLNNMFDNLTDGVIN